MAGLAPVAWVPDLAAALAAPLAPYPDGSGMRGSGVVAPDPDVAMAVPTLIAGNPDPVAVPPGRSRDDLDRVRWRRPDTNHDLSGSDGCSQDDGSGGSEKTSRQVHSSLLKVLVF